MKKINYSQIKSVKDIQKQKLKLQKSIKKQESLLKGEWNEIKAPFVKYLPVIQTITNVLSFAPLVIDSILLGKNIISMFKDKKEE